MSAFDEANLPVSTWKVFSDSEATLDLLIKHSKLLESERRIGSEEAHHFQKRIKRQTEKGSEFRWSVDPSHPTLFWEAERDVTENITSANLVEDGTLGWSDLASSQVAGMCVSLLADRIVTKQGEIPLDVHKDLSDEQLSAIEDVKTAMQFRELFPVMGGAKTRAAGASRSKQSATGGTSTDRARRAQKLDDLLSKMDMEDPESSRDQTDK